METITPALSPDRQNLAVETARQTGGPLDPDSWTTPRGERLTTFLNTETDQQRIDSYAYEWLQTATTAQAKGQGGGIDKEYREGLRQYAEFRKARGEQPFQYLKQAKTRADDRAARAQVPFFQKLFSNPDQMAEAFPVEQRESFVERFSASLDPAGEKQRTAGVLLVSAMTGKPADEVADLWPQYREAYGRDVLGISGKLDDAVFYQAAGQAFEKEAKDAETAAKIAQQAQHAAIQGRPLSAAIEQAKATAGDEWKAFAPAARAGYAGILSAYSDAEIKAARALFEATADMEGRKVSDIAQGDGKKAAHVIALESYGAADQATRDRIMALLAMQAEAEGEDIQNYFKRLGAAAASGLDMLTIGTGTLTARGNVGFFEDIAAKETDPAERARMQTEINRMKGTAAFAQDLATAGIKTRRYLDDKREGFWDTFADWGVMAAESLPVMGAAALPFGAGLPAVIAAYGERNISQLRREQPDADSGTIAAIAYTAAPIEAGIDRLQFLTLGARLPKLNAKLMQWGKPGAVAVTLARIGTVTAAEAVQEVGQDLTRPMVQELAAVLSDEIKGPNWDTILADEAEALGDIAGVSLIFGVIGGTGSTIMDYARAPRISEVLQDRDGLALAGYSPETIEEVATLAAENPAAAAEALKAARIETPKEERQTNSQAARERLEGQPPAQRISRATGGRVTSYGYAEDTTPDANSAAGIGAWVSQEEAERIRAGEDTPNRLRPGDMAVSRDIEATFREAGVQPGDVVTIRLSDGTEHSGRWMDRTAESHNGATLTGRFDLYSPEGLNPLDGREVVGWSYESTMDAETIGNLEAGIPTLEKQPDGRIQVNFPNAPAVLYDDQEQALEGLREWEQAEEMDVTRAVRDYLSFLEEEYHASNPEATFTGRQTNTEPTLETWAGDNKERIAKANARIDILMRQAGTDMGLERPLLSDVPILGTSRNIRSGAITRMVAEINRTGTPLTVIEESAEAVGKWLIADGKVSESKMIGWIRQTEQQTKTKILADDIATMPELERQQEIAEAFSFIARNNAVGRIQDSALPSQVKRFFAAFKEMIAQALRIAAEFARLRSEGKIDAEFGYWLDVAAGLEPEFMMDNLTRQMEAEMLAESMDGFTEIQEALKGKIPHPDTLKAAGDPLAGEVASLMEGIMNNPENGANKAARTRKANEFFLPKGQKASLDEVRRGINELGFEFTTPAEMIEAADLSINFGRKQFGTMDNETGLDEDTFSIADPDAWEPTFSVALRRVAPADYPATAREVIGITNVQSLTSAMLEPGSELVPLDESKTTPMMVSPAYRAAKRGGDPQAAWDITGKFITAAKIKALVDALAGKQPVFVPVTQAESDRVNMLPLAAAHRLQSLIGGRVEDSIHIPKKGTGGNTGADAVSRMAKVDEFTGSMTATDGEAVVLVDDTFTTGNTLTGLFDYLAGQGFTPQAVFSIASGRYSKALAPTPAIIQAALDKAGVSADQFTRETGIPIERFTGAELRAYTLNGARGIDGFRRRFGLESGPGGTSMVSRPDRQGEAGTDQVSQEPGSIPQGETFSIALRTDPLLAAIEAQIKTPEKKAEVWQKMKARVSAVKRRFEDRRMRGEFDNDAGDIDRARFEQIRDVAILEAIGKAMTPDIRGKIVGSFRRVADLKTSKARTAYMTALIPKIERALETGLQKHYRAAIRREFDRSAVKVSEARTRGGKIGAVAHAIIEQARQAMALKPEQADATADKLRDELETAPSLTPEQLEELDGKIAALELFQDFENADSARMAEGLQLLRDIRTEGRKEWLAILAERRSMREHRVKTLRQGLNLDRPIDFAERPRTKRKGEKLAARINEGFMEWMLSNSQKLRRLGELTDDPLVIATVEQMEGDFLEAELAENDMNRADNQALALAMRSIFGVSTEYAVAKKLRELTATDGEIPVTKIEGFKEEEIRVPKQLAEAIIRGEVNGFTDANGRKIELDAYDVAALDAAWEKFSELEDTEQNRRRILTFTRRVSKGKRRTLGELNQLEALQILLTMNQPDQGTKMEALGFDETTRTELEAFLRPEVKALGAWMVDYLKADTSAVDAIHRAEKGVGLGLVENYFPIRNDVSRADSGGLSLDGQPVQQGGRSVSFIKERVTNYANPAVVNALAVFLSHRAQVNFFKSHVAPLREWAGVIRDDGFAAAVKTRMGETFYASLTRTLERIETGGTLNAKALTEFERSLKGLLKTFALGTLGMRISTIMVNATAALNVFFEIRADKLIKGALQVAKRPEAFKDAFNSKPIRRRLKEGATFEAKLAKASGPSDRPLLAVSNSLAEKGMFPINFIDTSANLLGAAAVWEDTRAAAVRAGVDAEAAKAMADAKVERLLLRAAQPTTRLARSEFEQRVLDNPLSAFFALFVSEPRKNLAITYMAVRELTTGKGTYGKTMAAQQAATGLVFYLAAEFVVRSLFSAFAKAKDDEEDELFARWWNRLTDAKAWGHHMATGHLRGIPIFGEFWNAAMAKSFDQPLFDKSPNPVLKLTTIPGNVEDVFTGTTEEQAKAAARIVQTLGTVIPGGSSAAQVANLADFAQGLATSNGVSFSDEDRARRIKARFNAFKTSLDEIHGPTQQPTGKTTTTGKPATKADKRIQSAKWTAMTDRLRADLAPLSPELRAMVLDAVAAPKDVKKRVAKELKTASAAP